jgi:hypothetical protein
VPELGIVTTAVAIMGTERGDGYWVVDTAGGVFAFGEAEFHGSLPQVGELRGRVVTATRGGDGRGYWLVTADGAVFPFGLVPFLGSLAARGAGAPIAGIAARD